MVQEFSALRKPEIWIIMLVAPIGIASIFAVYTFIGPIVIDVANLGRSFIAVVLAVFGVGV